MNAAPPDRELLSGTDALVSLMLRQRALDRAAGLDTAGFVSGYRGSPLGGVDLAMWRMSEALERDAIRFVPGLNEELAATAVWGTQQLARFGRPRRAGVFALWYGKNPGLDRIGDVLKHANMEGTAPLGGVLAATGDDPAASSSTIANQGEQAFIAAMSPVLYPCDVEDMLALGLAGFAMSRYCGLWVGFKLVSDVVESTRSIVSPVARASSAPFASFAPFAIPADFAMPAGGLNCRSPDDRWSQDERTLRHRLPAAQAFARANGLDRTEIAPQGRKRIAFVAAGKAYRDLREAFAMLGLEADELARHGVGVRRIALVWPIEEQDNAALLRDFAEVLVVEEKRAVIEPQLVQLAYHWPAQQRPRFHGKRDADGRPALPEHGEVEPSMLARVVLERLAAEGVFPAQRVESMSARLAACSPSTVAARGGESPTPTVGGPTPSVESPTLSVENPTPGVGGPTRKPHFCSGCPHARSTRLPEGSQAMAGIGCHSMAMWMPGSRTTTLCQMGGEGANWIGASSFVDVPHMFQNLGDGTYTHSGVLAIRAAVAAKAPITYKILVNEAVAMTGGQPVEGAPGAARIAWQLHAEGVERIALLTGRGAAFAGSAKDLPPGTRLGDRDDLDEVMRAFREHRGVSAIVYDQICATEKRRLRRRGARFADEPVVTIHERICDGCGDCSVQSHCSAVRQVDTIFGSKRRIDESSCNTDLSCMDGYCPSFVTIENVEAVSRARAVPLPRALLDALPEPRRAVCGSGRPFGIVLAGVGGSGLVTAGSVLASAALHEGLAVTQLDNTGLARKGGEVTTHLRIAEGQRIEGASRIPVGGADLLIAGDLASAASPGVVARLASGARAVVSNEATPMLEQALDPDAPLPVAAWRARLERRLGPDAIAIVDAPAIARQALGDTLYANMIVIGAAAQRGLLPVSVAAVEHAIRERGISVETNLAAFSWGRLAAAQPQKAAAMLEDPAAAGRDRIDELADPDAAAAYFAAELERYQDRRLADRYRALVHGVVRAAQRAGGDEAGLALAVARNAFDALAIKDEYEVARLASDPHYLSQLRQRYGARARPVFHFAPAWLPRRATRDGRRRKLRFGAWILVVLRVLARMRRLRGSVLDPFAWQSERIAQRRFTRLYCQGLERIAASLDSGRVAAALEFVRLPEGVRGYGPVRMPRLQTATQAAQRLLQDFEPRSALPTLENER
ncbi:MAG: indolepyruvate ferredoxin oxidoreductase family protein [Burkholderiaceae bacterium]|nr:indolepyruvate ferredoxin oxidoreductase family protein [Burkholderiaceae bacterium]